MMEIDRDNIWHVNPRNDSEEHLLEVVFPHLGKPYCECKCKPTYKQEGTGFIVIHNSFDGREGVEWTNKILKHDLAQLLRKETGASLSECKKIIEQNPTGTIADWKDDLRRFGRKF